MTMRSKNARSKKPDGKAVEARNTSAKAISAPRCHGDKSNMTNFEKIYGVEYETVYDEY